MKLPIHLVMAATGATLFDADNAPLEVEIATDTRSLRPGQTFVALRGSNFNGHEYTKAAAAAGAGMIVVDEPWARVEGTATMVVERTIRAYMALASVARALYKGRVIAITGSAGKTTTKVFLAQLLARHYGTRVHVPPANENNEIGVSKLMLSASNEEHDVVVVEMGARNPGDIAALVEVARPDVGILTNVGDAHVEIFGSREALADTKWALFARGARAVINAADEVSIARAPSLPAPAHWFFAGDSEPPARGERITALLGTSRLVDRSGTDARELPVACTLPGLHNRANAAAAAAGALELDVPFETIAPAIAQLVLPEGRYETLPMPGGWRLIFDAYNANASGTLAALDTLGGEQCERTIAVLGSMAELGDESQALHERVGEHAARHLDVLLVSGDFASALAEGARKGGLSSEQIVPVETNHDAARWLRENARAGDAVLLKGSRKYKLEEIVEELRGS